MRRREFITLLGGAAVAWPLAARAQQAERVRRVGVLIHLAESDSEGQARLGAFRQGLAIDINCGLSIHIDVICAVRHQAAIGGEIPLGIYRGQSMASGEVDDQSDIGDCERVW